MQSHCPTWFNCLRLSRKYSTYSFNTETSLQESSHFTPMFWLASVKGALAFSPVSFGSPTAKSEVVKATISGYPLVTTSRCMLHVVSSDACAYSVPYHIYSDGAGQCRVCSGRSCRS